MLFEERLRLGAVGKFEPFGDPAGIAQRDAKRLRIGWSHGLGGDRFAAHAKRMVGGKMIIVFPARDIGPGQRRVLAAADLQRPFEVRVWQGTRGWLSRMTEMTCRKRTQWHQQQYDSDHSKRKPCKVARFSERCQCQPASNSDRERSCRGRMSRHR